MAESCEERWVVKGKLVSCTRQSHGDADHVWPEVVYEDSTGRWHSHIFVDSGFEHCHDAINNTAEIAEGEDPSTYSPPGDHGHRWSRANGVEATEELPTGPPMTPERVMAGFKQAMADELEDRNGKRYHRLTLQDEQDPRWTGDMWWVRPTCSCGWVGPRFSHLDDARAWWDTAHVVDVAKQAFTPGGSAVIEFGD